MTREEAKDIVFNYALGQKINDGINTLDEIIDKIFDDHEKELKQAYIDGSNSNNKLIHFYLHKIEAQHKMIETMYLEKGITFCAKCSKELIKEMK
jgi:hypothetical protein